MTQNREVCGFVKNVKGHLGWKCFLITYDKESTEEGI